MPSECISKPLQRALADSICSFSSLDEIRIVIACGAKVDDPVTLGLRPLHYACWQHYPEAAHLLLVRGCDVNALDDAGYSALHLATEHGHLDMVDLLVKHQAKINFLNSDGCAPSDRVEEPLRLAIRNNHFEIAKLLLENGANPNTRYFFGSEINLVSPLNTEFLQLLLAFGAFPDTRDRNGLTPLMKACSVKTGMESVLLFLYSGADVNAIGNERNDFRTVLHYAVIGGDPDVLALLLKQGARVNLSPDYDHPTPLHLAILKGDFTMVKMLIEAGANVNACSPVIGAPLHVACADRINSRYQIIQLLLTKGADPNIIVYSEEGSPLKSVMAEYIASNEDIDPAIIRILLEYGAKVVFRSTWRDPCGLLQLVPRFQNHPIIYDMLLKACHSFDTSQIRRCAYLSEQERQFLLSVAQTPLTLLQQSRIYLRTYMTDKPLSIIEELPIPQIMKKYLLYQIR